MAFEMNQGQAAKGVDFVAHGQGYTAQLRANSLALGLSNRISGEKKTTPRTQMTLLGANQRAKAEGEEKLPGHSNYLLGSDPAGWVTNVEQYARVRYSNVYPGIDVIYHGDESGLEHDFVVHPGANPKQVLLTFSGVETLNLCSNGDLALHMSSGELRLQKPRAYQRMSGGQVEVAAAYVVDGTRVSFRIGKYDRGQNLVIDPVVVYSTFLGGTEPSDLTQSALAAAVDASGNLYVAGGTSASNFPVTPGALQTSGNGESTFISKINPAGTR